MTLFDDLKAFLSREGTTAKEWVDQTVSRGNRALEDAERRRGATSEERVRDEQEDIKANDEAFEDIRRRAERATATADADVEVVEVTRTPPEPTDEE